MWLDCCCNIAIVFVDKKWFLSLSLTHSLVIDTLYLIKFIFCFVHSRHSHCGLLFFEHVSIFRSPHSKLKQQKKTWSNYRRRFFIVLQIVKYNINSTVSREREWERVIHQTNHLTSIIRTSSEWCCDCCCYCCITKWDAFAKYLNNTFSLISSFCKTMMKMRNVRWVHIYITLHHVYRVCKL